MAGKQRAKKGNREKSVASKQRSWVKILFSMGDIVTQLQGTLQSGLNVMFGKMTFSNQMNNQSSDRPTKQTNSQTNDQPPNQIHNQKYDRPIKCQINHHAANHLGKKCVMRHLIITSCSYTAGGCEN